MRRLGQARALAHCTCREARYFPPPVTPWGPLGNFWVPEVPVPAVAAAAFAELTARGPQAPASLLEAFVAEELTPRRALARLQFRLDLAGTDTAVFTSGC